MEIKQLKWVRLAHLLKEHVPKDKWLDFTKEVDWDNSSNHRDNFAKDQYHYKIEEYLMSQNPFGLMIENGAKDIALLHYNSLSEEQQNFPFGKLRNCIWFRSIQQKNIETIDWLLNNNIPPHHSKCELLITLAQDSPELWEQIYISFEKMKIKEKDEVHFDPYFKENILSQVLASCNQKLLDFFLQKDPDLLKIPGELIKNAIEDGYQFNNDFTQYWNFVDNFLKNYNLWSKELVKIIEQDQNKYKKLTEVLIDNHDIFPKNFFKQKTNFLFQAFELKGLEFLEKVLNLIPIDDIRVWNSMHFKIEREQMEYAHFGAKFKDEKSIASEKAINMVLEHLIKNWFNINPQTQLEIFQKSNLSIQDKIKNAINQLVPEEYQLDSSKLKNNPVNHFEVMTHVFNSNKIQENPERNKPFKML